MTNYVNFLSFYSEWSYISKIFYEGTELKFEPLETDQKNMRNLN